MRVFSGSVLPRDCRSLITLPGITLQLTVRILVACLCPGATQLGGGDQIYCDHVMDLPSLKPWLAVDDPHVGNRAHTRIHQAA